MYLFSLLYNTRSLVGTGVENEVSGPEGTPCRILIIHSLVIPHYSGSIGLICIGFLFSGIHYVAAFETDVVRS